MKVLSSIICIFVICAALCHTIFALPRTRVKRNEDLKLNDAFLDPVQETEISSGDDELHRRKRKLPEATFAAKNAVLGFVFGKIDNIIDSKTRFLDALDRTNIEKNRQFNITVPRPINDFQGLITAVVSPKITSITQALGSLTTGVLGGVGSLNGGAQGNNGAAQGIGNIVTKFLSFSGPILQSSGGNTGGGNAPPPTPSADEAGY